ncbi:MAG: hypothetical protein U9O78_00170 [Patescibacteria group bacterium]|nr:hypothetical protein [Patescibacteria group bacterium]
MKDSQPQSLPECFPTVQTIIAVTTGNRIASITPDVNLEVDLAINLDIDLPEIVLVLNQEYKADSLDLDPNEVKQELRAGDPTSLELANIVEEVRNLG